MKKPGPVQFRWLALLLTAGLIAACTQKGFLSKQSSSSQVSIQPAALEPNTKASDRPVDTGAGVPGYLVCSLFTVQDENVQVGCNMSDTAGAKQTTGPEAWTRYDIKLPADAPYGVSITKTLASNLLVWDVNFNFKGATKDVLSDVARKSAYGYVYVNASGQAVRIETVPPPVPPPVAAPSTSNTTTCLGGAFVDNVCFVPVDVSCTDYCARGAMQPHPYVIDRFGVSRDTDEDLNKQACFDLYVKIRGTPDIRFEDLRSLHGWGCFETFEGRVAFDKSDTDPLEYPRIGDRRICGCL